MAERAMIFDWSDACIGNPLLDLVHLCAHPPRTAPAGIAWTAPWVQAYVKPWREGYDEQVLRRALDLVDVADLAFQAVAYGRIQRSLEPAARHHPDGARPRSFAPLVDRFRRR